jgi:hypothetical protein
LTIHKIVEGGMSFLYLPLFCGLSNILISATAGNVVPLSSIILWIVKIPCKIVEDKGRTFPARADIRVF